MHEGDNIERDKIGRQINTEGNYYEKYINYGEKKINRILSHSLPFVPQVFMGRDDELKTVHDRLFGGENFLMLVNGQGGIGKTTFASKYWQKYEHKYHHLAFLFVENDIANALLGLARNLGLEFPLKSTTAEQLQQLIQFISNLKKPCLLILDNANHEDDLKQNITFLSQCDNFHILMTSRLADFDYSQKYTLGALDKPDALEVFKTHYKAMDAQEIILFDEVFDAVGGNTLVLELLAKNLHHFNTKLRKRYTFQNLLDDLQNGLTKLSQTKAVETVYHAKGTGLRYETPEAIILAMYDLTELDDYEKKLLSIFAVLPAENIEFETLEKFEDADDLDLKLRELAQKGWIEEKDTNYKMSPVIQEVTRKQNQERLVKDCEELIDNLQDEYQLIREDRLKGVWLISYIKTVLRYLPFNYESARLQLNLTNLLIVAGEIQQAEQNINNLLNHSNIIDIGGLQIYVVATNLKALIYYKQDKVDEAITTYKGAEGILKISRKNQTDNGLQKILADIYYHLSLCFDAKEDTEQVDFYMKKSLKLQSSNDMQTVIQLSYKYEREGRTAKALDIIKEKIKEIDTPENSNHIDLGIILLRTSQLITYSFRDGAKISITFLEKAKKIFENQPIEYPDKIENLYYELSVCYNQLNDLKKASRFAQKGNEIFATKYGENHSELTKFQNLIIEINKKIETLKFKSIGRNDICPCGSGKKYKKCCGKSK